MNSYQVRTQAGRASRRQFLQGAGAALGAAVLPAIVPATVFGATAPSNRIHVGFIGCGNQSEIDLPAFLGQEDAQVLAVCDVNTASGGYKVPKQFLGRKPAQEKVNSHYAAARASGQYKGCDAYNDFREILARPDIDVVTIVVPDHWHALMTVLAAQAGKDIYCEKPLSLCIRHGRAMVEAVRKHQRVLQTGTHYRSSPAARLACELVRNGRIGKLQRIMSYVAENNAVDPGPGWKPMPVPAGFDYAFWLGPAPLAPYHKDRCFYRFRFNLDYSGGQTTNFGTHTNDLAQWAWAPTTAGRSSWKIRAASGRRRADSTTRPPRSPSAPAMPTASRSFARPGKKGLACVSSARKAGCSMGMPAWRANRPRQGFAHRRRRNPSPREQSCTEGGTGPVPRPRPCPQFPGLRPFAKRPAGFRRSGASFDLGLPPGEHRHAAEAETPLGPGEGGISRRRRGQSYVGPADARPWSLG